MITVIAVFYSCRRCSADSLHPAAAVAAAAGFNNNRNFVHPNLVQLYGVCTTVRPIYIVQELVTEGCLLDYLRNNDWLKDEVDKLHYMAEQAASAMVFLETRKFIHRDLVCSRLLLSA